MAELARSLYDAFAQGDVEAVLSGMDPDIVWNEAENFIYADGNPYEGPEQILNGVFARLATEWEDFRLEEKQFYSVDNHAALVTGRYRGTYRKNGADLNAQFAHLWTFRNSRALTFQQYTDTLQAMRIIGK